MAEIVKDFFWGMPAGLYIILLFAIGLCIAGFIVPPIGVISGSVLEAMGIILGATWLFYTTTHIPQILASGAKIKASYGNAKVEIGKKSEGSAEDEENKEGLDE